MCISIALVYALRVRMPWNTCFYACLQSSYRAFGKEEKKKYENVLLSNLPRIFAGFFFFVIFSFCSWHDYYIRVSAWNPLPSVVVYYYYYYYIRYLYMMTVHCSRSNGFLFLQDLSLARTIYVLWFCHD